MRAALSLGAHGLELDVHCTADPSPIVVVAHDDDLEKMTGAKARIRDVVLDTLRSLDAGHNWVPGKVATRVPARGDTYPLRGMGPRDHDLRIPTLEEVFDAFPQTPLNLEIKAKGAALPLAELLTRTGREDVIVVSFRDWWLRRFRRAAPTVPTAAGGLAILLFWFCSRVGAALPVRHHVALQVPWRFGPLRICDERLVKAAHRRGLAVHVWTVDDADVMHAAIDIEVDGIMTDRPTVMALVLRERNVGWM